MTSADHRTVARELAASLRSFGLRRTVAVIASRLVDYGFDLYYGTDTVAKVEVEALGTSSPNVGESQIYQGTGVYPFLKFMREYSFPPGSVFVDFGSGKGRALLLAAMLPFESVIGLEFSPALCDVAEKNVARVRSKKKKLAPIRIVRGDAALYNFTDAENVFYFFHPFGESMMATILNRIEESLRRAPRDAWIFYYLSKHKDVVKNHGPSFRHVGDRVVGGYDLSVFESRAT
jgi:SAM-dependent methyltransferase